MNIYIYSDESGVFDYIHNRWYIFGGVILLSKKEKELAVRKYIHAEKVVRAKESLEKKRRRSFPSPLLRFNFF